MSGVELLFGPMLIGVFLNTILYGILIVQAFIYYQTYKKQAFLPPLCRTPYSMLRVCSRDASWIRYLVLYLFILDTLNTGFDIGMMYEPLVVRYGSERAVTIAPIMLSADPIVTVMVSTPVQLFIAWRIKIISRSNLLTSIIAFFAICSFVGGIATTIAVTLIPQYSRLQEFNGAVITWLGASAAADVLITGILVWSLYRRKTGIKATDDHISRIIRLTVQTGAVTAIAAFADVLIFVLLPKTTLNFIFDFALSKLYTNSLLSTLNARAGWKNLGGQANDTHNVLFGNQDPKENSSKETRRIEPSSRNRQVLTTDVFELEPHTSIKPNSAYKSHYDDLEHSISVTKVVERVQDQEQAYGERGAQ